MVTKEDIRYQKGLENLKKISKQFKLEKGFLDGYQKGKRCMSILSEMDPEIANEVVNYFEEKFPDTFVYYTIFQDTPYGGVVNMLYYNNEKDEWYLNDVNEEGWIYAATYNLDINYFEFGDIKLGSIDGILCRKG